MRLIVLLLLASVFGYGILQIDKIDPNNYVKMYLGNYVVEVKVLGFVLLLIAIVVVLYFLLWLFRLIWRSPKNFSLWRDRRNHEQAELQLGAGYLSLIKGDWSKAEKQLLTKSKHSAVPYVNYLAAAQAAQQQGRVTERDDYLAAAYDAAPNERLAIGLTKAKLHQQAGQMDLALATLSDLGADGRKNPQYTAMLMQTYEELQDWSKAKELLPTVKKQNALSLEALIEIQNKIYHNALADADDIEQAWKELPRDQKKNVHNIKLYVDSLVSNGEISSAEKIIRTTLKNSWSDELVDAYGKLSTDKPAKSLRAVEGWLMARPENARLQLAAGRLAMAANNTDAAKQYLQTAITLAQLPEAYAALGELFEGNNDSGQALKLYRNAMQALSKPVQEPASKIAKAVAEPKPADNLRKNASKEGELIEANRNTSAD